MKLQLLRHGIGRLAGLAIVISVLGIVQAQVVTHTQLSFASGNHGPTFTANVSDSTGHPATDGIVTLRNSQGASVGSAFVNNGEATLRLDQSISGRIYAVYSGSNDFRSSTAQLQISKDDTSSEPDFSVSANPTSVTLSPGQFATIIITITPINGFNNMVTLSCSDNPPASTCIFSPTTLTPLNGATITSSLQLTTLAPSGSKLEWPGRSSHAVYAVVLPGLLALVGLGGLRKRSRMNAFTVLGLAALLAASSLGLSACAQRYDYLHHPPNDNPGIAAGNYTFTIAAYSNNGASVTSHTVNIALTVN